MIPHLCGASTPDIVCNVYVSAIPTWSVYYTDECYVLYELLFYIHDYNYVQGKNDIDVTRGDVLGQFSYSLDGTPIQEFTISDVSLWMQIAAFWFMLVCVSSRRVWLILTSCLNFCLIMAMHTTLVCIV